MAAQPVAVAPRASLLRNRYAVFGVVMLVLLMGTMNVTLVLVAVLHIQQGLDTTLAWVSWTVTGHQLAQVATMPLAAKLGDQFGRKRVFLGAIVCFLAGSTGAGLAPNIGTLILFRVVMGFGVGAFMPSAAGIVADLFPRQRAKMIGLFSTFLPFGWVLGPNLGGFVVGNLSWRWAMLANAPIAIVAFAAMAAMLTESRRAAARHHFDVMGASLLAGGVISFMLAFTLLGGRYSISFLSVPPLFALSLALLWLFWRHE
ncbi:MAG: MFS transporter, partial [SAR202 cluster bacterium]|nr:MFS transporter [SAR202 cluster bacterium]